MSEKWHYISYITSWKSWLDTKRESTWQVEFLIVTERRFLSSAPARQIHIIYSPFHLTICALFLRNCKCSAIIMFYSSHQLRQLLSNLPLRRATWYPVPPNASSHLPNLSRTKKPSKVVCMTGDLSHLLTNKKED